MSWSTDFANSIIQTDGENAITELAQQAAQQLGLPARQSPTYDHQSQGSVERFHQTLFAQLHATRFQWASHLGLEHHKLLSASLPWLLQHSVFVINRFLVRNNGQTSFAANYGYNYTVALLNFGETVYADIKRIGNRKLAIRNEHQKVTGIWLGRDHTTGQHLIALPDQHRDHPGVSGNNICKTRHVTRLPQEHNSTRPFFGPSSGCSLTSVIFHRSPTTKSLESPTSRSTNSFFNRTPPFENNDPINHLNPPKMLFNQQLLYPKYLQPQQDLRQQLLHQHVRRHRLIFNHLLAYQCPSNFLELIFVHQH